MAYSPSVRWWSPCILYARCRLHHMQRAMDTAEPMHSTTPFVPTKAFYGQREAITMTAVSHTRKQMYS